MAFSAEHFAAAIVEKLQAGGHVAYFAGGCVRDRLMGRVPKDFDVATSARPQQVLALYPHSQKVGVAFGVVLVRERRGPGKEMAQVEVATFRSDGAYTDSRHPDSVRFTTAEEDAKRRDFSCNGLFWDPIRGELHDFVGGRKDIDEKILRAIGDPFRRFAEDHLRMLRAIRFAAKLEFAIEPATFAAIQSQAAQIRTVSKERIHDELCNILTHPARARAGSLLQTSRLLEHLWPAELFAQPERPRQWAALAALPVDADFVQALIGVYRECAEQHPARAGGSLQPGGGAIAQVLRQAFLLNNTETDDLAWLLDNLARLAAWESLSKAPLKRLIADPRWPRLAALFVALDLDPALRPTFEARMSELQREGAAPAPFVTGEVLIRLGASPGKRFKGWLESLYDRQLEGEFADAAAALAAAQGLIAGK